MPLLFSLPHLPTPSLTGSLHLGLSVCLSGPACETPLAVSGTRPFGGRELIGASRSWGVGGAASGEASGEPVVAGTGHCFMWPTPQEG